ncbi:PEP-CTERM sorting domain-containing protein [Nostoc ellipsosporum NOK]|nr:PEP-CTERM sorting domain-containing protein [Nostoc ellipsosporum NOK]
MYQAINKFFKIAASTVVVTLSLSMFSTSKAAAVTFNFSYQFSSGNLLSGNFEGDLGLDADTISNISNLNAQFSALPGVTYNNARLFSSNTSLPAIASLSGNQVDIFGTNFTFGNGEGFLLFNSLNVASVGNAGITDIFLFIGGTREYENFNINSWKATIASVPEPSVILGLATLGTGLLVSRKKSAKDLKRIFNS